MTPINILCVAVAALVAFGRPDGALLAGGALAGLWVSSWLILGPT